MTDWGRAWLTGWRPWWSLTIDIVYLVNDSSAALYQEVYDR